MGRRDGWQRILRAVLLGTVVAAGVDVAEMVYRLAHGDEPDPQLDYPAGRQVRFLPGDLMWFLTSPRRFKALGDFLGCRGLSRPDLLLSWQDPGPIIGYILENLLLSRAELASRFRLRQATGRRP